MFHYNHVRILFYLTFLSLIIFITFPLLLFAETDRVSTSGEKTPLTTILENAEELTEVEKNKILTILKLDVFGYFNLYDKYNTPLKREVFKKTSEYKDKLNELKAKKQEIQKKLYYVTLKPDLKEYNVNKRGFDIPITSNILIYGPGSIGPSKTVEGVHFPSLPVKVVPWRVLGEQIKGAYIEIFFLPSKEEDALYIEDIRDKIKLFFIFKIYDTKLISWQSCEPIFSSWTCYLWNDKTEVIVANSVRMVIANEKTGEVYLDRVWPSGKK